MWTGIGPDQSGSVAQPPIAPWVALSRLPVGGPVQVKAAPHAWPPPQVPQVPPQPSSPHARPAHEGWQTLVT